MLAEFVDRADVGMIERRGGSRLTAETFQRLRIVAQIFRQELQRDSAAQLQVFRPVNHAHAAAANDVQHSIVRNRPAGQTCRLQSGTRWLAGSRSGLQALHRNHEPVPAARHRLDVLRFVRRITQRLPQLLHGGVNAVVELHHRVVGPELLLDLFARHQFARTLHQHQQNLEGLFLKTNLLLAFTEFSGLEVAFKRPNLHPDWRSHFAWNECREVYHFMRVRDNRANTYACVYTELAVEGQLSAS